MQKFQKRLIHMYHCRGITRHFIKKLLTIDPMLSSLYDLTSSELHNLYRLPMKNATTFLKDLHSEQFLFTISQNLKPYDIITYFDENYPLLLKEINDPPLVLFTYGDQSLLNNSPSISVIGTRNPSEVAYQKVQHYLIPLLKKQWTIVSGMAYGVDGFAHRVTLNNEEKTIAVLGGGFHHIYPKQHEQLFENIGEKGLVISEYPPHIRPRRYHFPERNRIISGLSFATLVIEATQRSGTLITVDQALDQGRQVYAAPGTPFIKQTIGCHRLIQDGAKLVIDGTDILDDWEIYGRKTFVQNKINKLPKENNNK